VARSQLLDYLQQFRFHLFDVPKFTGGGGAAAFSMADTVFSLVAGFASVTSPEMTLELETIKEGTSQFDHFVAKRASVGPIALSRGVRFNDAEFWKWISGHLSGQMPKRTLLLVQFTKAKAHIGSRLSDRGQGISPSDRATQRLSDVTAQEVRTDYLLRVPGKTWVLVDCTPSRYKSGSDMDAKSSEVSIAELELQPAYFYEVTPTSPFSRSPF
jgi:phage tail-like protein